LGKLRKVKADIILLGAIVAVGCVIGLILLVYGHGGSVVQVRVEGAVIETFPLSENRSYEINGINGGTNVLIIQDGEAWVEEASCPDGLCKSMGRISMSGQSIICLPNKVVIEILDKSRETPSSEIDVIVR
jgi:hypothetical protein